MDSTVGIGAVSAQPLGTCSETPAQACIGKIWKQQQPAASENELTSPLSLPRKSTEQARARMQSHCSVGELEGCFATDSNEAGGYVGSVGPAVIEPSIDPTTSCGALESVVVAPALSAPCADDEAICGGTSPDDGIVGGDSARVHDHNGPVDDGAASMVSMQAAASVQAADITTMPALSMPFVDDGALSTQGVERVCSERGQTASAPCVEDGAISAQDVLPGVDSAVSDTGHDDGPQNGDDEPGNAGKRVRPRSSRSKPTEDDESKRQRGSK